MTPPGVPSDRAKEAYEQVFFSSANSNESKLKLLEERLTGPLPGSGTMSDACAAGRSRAADEDDDSDDDLRAFGVVANPESGGAGGGKKRKHRSGGSGASAAHAAGAATPAAPGVNAMTSPLGDKGKHAAADAKIADYFKPTGASPPPPGSTFAGAVATPASGSERKENYPPGAGDRPSSAGRGAAARADHEWVAALREARASATKAAEAEKARADAAERKLVDAEALIDALRAELESARERERATAEDAKARDAERVEGVKRLAVSVAQFERQRARARLAEEGGRLGVVSVQRAGGSFQEVWEDGRAFAELNARAVSLTHAKEAAEQQRKLVKRRLPLPGVTEASADPAAAQAAQAAQAEYVLSEEAHKVRVGGIKREEDAIAREREALEREKNAHIRELKRARDEDSSRFNQHPLLGGRYVLMNMLGRGGFSEVYKAYDVAEMREVACKVHQLSQHWSEARKSTYVRHATRECSIHKRLDHSSVVKHVDVFEVDQNSFCTVLELCTGDDLDARLKAHGPIAEREARIILAQGFAGLNYLAGGARPVIHYDLKPGNILFDAAGRVKITDFGLSKEMDGGGALGGGIGDSGMELTSQGAGTYWYLPPECFETGPAPPKISSKVDTWSCGVILYQMLYDRKPFGHDQSQEQILHAGTILNAQQVEFPATPKVSAECKEFIKRCLARKQADRPDVSTAAADPYMTYAKTE